MRVRRGLAIVLVALTVPGVGCGGDSLTAAPGPEPSGTRSSVPGDQRDSVRPPLCDPGFGAPRARKECPDPEPDTGWVRVTEDGRMVLQPFRTLRNDAEGRAYAEWHSLEFPFANDYFDARVGEQRFIELSPDTVCTGVILVGYREPLEDHVVACGELVEAARRSGGVPVAVWSQAGSTFQVSELYRP